MSTMVTVAGVTFDAKDEEVAEAIRILAAELDDKDAEIEALKARLSDADV